MITSIKISNSSGIKDEVVLDLKKGKYDYRNHFIYKDKVVNPAILYGRNGSGKTSVLKSINNIIQVFSGDITSGEYYAMSNMFSDDEITNVELYFELNECEYKYQVWIKNRDEIEYEFLSKDDELLIERSNRGIKYVAHELSNGKTRNEIQQFTNPESVSYRMSFVRYMGQNDMNDFITEVYNYFKSFRFVATNKAISEIESSNALSEGKLLEKYNDNYDSIIRNYPHLMNLRFRVDKLASGERITALYIKDDVEYELDFETQISSGTKDLYRMLSTLLSLKPGSLIVIDELEKTLHPELLDNLITDIVTELDIQIICSSHNTHLLQSLRPDQVYFTKKENEMAVLSRLSVDGPGIREIHNIEKLYLGGRIG